MHPSLQAEIRSFRALLTDPYDFERIGPVLREASVEGMMATFQLLTGYLENVRDLPRAKSLAELLMKPHVTSFISWKIKVRGCEPHSLFTDLHRIMSALKKSPRYVDDESKWLTFAPASLTPGASGAQSTMVVQTAGQHIAGTKGLPPWPFTAPVFAALLLLFPQRRFRSGKQHIKSLACIVALLGFAVSTIGCGGGFALPSTAKTYTITVAGTSGSDTHSTTVTLTVQ
jgi:hypothetical protein